MSAEGRVCTVTLAELFAGTGSGSLAVTVAVKGTGPPRHCVGPSEAFFVPATSADAVTEVVTLAVLLAGLGSGSVAVTEAVLVMLPAADGVTTIVTVAVAALARVPSAHV